MKTIIALLTTTMPYMKFVIDTMKEKGSRDDYLVLVGGAPLTEELARISHRVEVHRGSE